MKKLSVAISKRLSQEKKKPGVYETEDGNAAGVRSWSSKTAYDLDMGERIPIDMVTDKFIRDLESEDYGHFD